MKKKTKIIIPAIVISLLLCSYIFLRVADSVGRSEREHSIYFYILELYSEYLREKIIENDYEIKNIPQWTDEYFTKNEQPVTTYYFEIYSKPIVYVDPIEKTAFIYIMAKNDEFRRYGLSRGYGLIIPLEPENWKSRLKISSYFD